MYVNNIVVVGNLTSDPQMGKAEAAVVNFRVGVNRWRKPDQEANEDVKERTEFIDVECWGSQADNIHTSLRRGDRVIVCGQLKYDQWNDDGGNFKSRVSIRAAAVGPSLEFQNITA